MMDVFIEYRFKELTEYCRKLEYDLLVLTKSVDELEDKFKKLEEKVNGNTDKTYSNCHNCDTNAHGHCSGSC